MRTSTNRWPVWILAALLGSQLAGAPALAGSAPFAPQRWQRSITAPGIQVYVDAVRTAPDGSYLVFGCAQTLSPEFAETAYVVAIDLDGSTRSSSVLDLEGECPLEIDSVARGGFLALSASWAVRLDAWGRVSWKTRLPPIPYPSGNPGGWEGELETSDGGFILGWFRYTDPDGLLGVVMARLSAAGALLWAREESDLADAVPGFFPAPGDGYFVVATGNAPRVARFGSDGRLEWDRPLVVPLEVRQVLAAPGRGLLAVGAYRARPTSLLPAAARLSPDGALLWSRAFPAFANASMATVVPVNGGWLCPFTIDGSKASYGALRIGDDGNAVASGTYRSGSAYLGTPTATPSASSGFFLQGTESGGGLFVVRLDEKLKPLAIRTYRPPVELNVRVARATSDGGLLLSGTTYEVLFEPERFFAARFSATGKPLWTRTYVPFTSAYKLSVELTADGGFLLGSSIDDPGADYSEHGYLMKADANGTTGPFVSDAGASP